MAPFRPTNLNKRYYPGNASVIGPTRTPTIGFSTTTCLACNCTICGTQNVTFVLGCRCMASTYDCCLCCCCCLCTVCTRTVPQGKYSKWEQYEARTRDAWGNSSCSNANPIGFCSNTGTTAGPTVDCKGFYICCGPSTTKWFVAPGCTELTRNWNNRGDGITVANSCMGSCGWFIPTSSQLFNPAACCRTYWDYSAGSYYWSDTPAPGGKAVRVSMPTPTNPHAGSATPYTDVCSLIRAFRTT